MWGGFAALWETVNPVSTTYDTMAEPLLAGDVWIAFDHIARLLPALRRQPQEFVAFPPPAGPKGRGFMSVLAGVAVAKAARDPNGARDLIAFLRRPQTQIATVANIGFLPIMKTVLPPDLEPALKMAAAAIEKTQSAKDALIALPPVGLGGQEDAFNRVFTDAFQAIVLRGEAPQAALDRGAGTLRRLMTDTGARCWRPDPPSGGPCPVQ